MSLSEKFRRCATFLYTAAPGDAGETVLTPRATAFLVSISAGRTFELYAVTARHCIAKARAEGVIPVVRLVADDGRIHDIEVPPDDWTFHPRSDVAASPVEPPTFFTVTALVEDELLTDERARAIGLGLGDDVAIVGLHTLRPGDTRPEPVVRFGRISRTKSPPMVLKLDDVTSSTPVEAYLVEALSWGGASGAPAFWVVAGTRVPSGLIVPAAGPHAALLGLVAGHDELEHPVVDSGQTIGGVSMNAGMAIVVPADAILETLMDDTLVERRGALAKRFESV